MSKNSGKDEASSSDRRGWFILIGLSLLGSVTANLPIIVMTLGIVVLLATLIMWNKGWFNTNAQPAKRKNDETDLDPMGLLTEDDREELRQELKQELRARISSGTDGELSTLDALLADPEISRKTTKK